MQARHVYVCDTGNGSQHKHTRTGKQSHSGDQPRYRHRQQQQQQQKRQRHGRQTQHTRSPPTRPPSCLSIHPPISQGGMHDARQPAVWLGNSSNSTNTVSQSVNATHAPQGGAGSELVGGYLVLYMINTGIGRCGRQVLPTRRGNALGSTANAATVAT